MKQSLKAALLFLVLQCAAGLVDAQSTAFTYNGRLTDSGAAANGTYDMTFTIFDAENAGNTIANPLSINRVNVANGLFALTLDFGAGVFTGPPRWLEVSVRRTASPNFTTLTPRQGLTSSPYAIFAGKSAAVADDAIGGLAIQDASISAAKIGAGQVVKSLNGLTDAVTLQAGANVSLTPNGNSLVLSAASGAGGPWGLNGTNTYYTAGNVGIGTASPAAGLEITAPWDGQQGNLTLSGQYPALRFTGGLLSGHDSWLMQVSPNGPGNLEFYNEVAGFGSWALMLALTPSGQVGLGTAFPTENLTIAGVTSFDNGLKLTGANANGTGLTLENTATGGHKYAIFSGGANDGVGAGGLGIYDESASAYRLAVTANGNVGIGKRNPQTALDINGTTTTKVLTITGGADIAEPFEMAAGPIEAGSVVVIDEDHPGQLGLSTRAYDTHVAGVVSGAQGIQPGLSLRQEGLHDRGQNVALTGRVYVLADATRTPIKPGDLLTTSDIPGRAMKVTDPARAQGAILGKAMSSLPEGKGTVLVLVTLQ